VKMLLCREW